MTSPKPYFKSSEHYERYRTVVNTIEQEKQYLHQLLLEQEHFTEELHSYDGFYEGLQKITGRLRQCNASIRNSKMKLMSLTKKYYELLKYFTVPLVEWGK